jgi:hypothetical protein
MPINAGFLAISAILLLADEFEVSTPSVDASEGALMGTFSRKQRQRELVAEATRLLRAVKRRERAKAKRAPPPKARPLPSAIGPKRTCQKTQSMSLLGVKRTSRFAVQMSAYDPKRTS